MARKHPRGVCPYDGARRVRPRSSIAAVTRDAVVVVTHDPELNPDCTRDARGRFLATAGPPIFTLTYAQLQSYDVGRLRPGSAYAARFPQQQPVDGERIPRLADVLTLVRTRGRGRVRVAVEVKDVPGAT